MRDGWPRRWVEAGGGGWTAGRAQHLAVQYGWYQPPPAHQSNRWRHRPAAQRRCTALPAPTAVQERFYGVPFGPLRSRGANGGRPASQPGGGSSSAVRLRSLRRCTSHCSRVWAHMLHVRSVTFRNCGAAGCRGVEVGARWLGQWLGFTHASGRRATAGCAPPLSACRRCMPPLHARMHPSAQTGHKLACGSKMLRSRGMASGWGAVALNTWQGSMDGARGCQLSR